MGAQFQEQRVRAQAPVPTVGFQRLVEQVHGKSMNEFFQQWGMLTNLPRFKLDRVTASRQGSNWRVQGHVLRIGNSLFGVPIPLSLQTQDGLDRQEVWLAKEDVKFEFPASSKPQRLLVDPEFELLKIQKMSPHMAQLWDAYPNVLLVYGTMSEAAANKAAAERFNNEYLGLAAEKIKADTEVSELELKAPCVCLFGRPTTNKITQRFMNWFPIRVADNGFAWNGTRYNKPTQGVIEAVAPSDQPKQLVLLYAALSAEAMKTIGDLMLYDPDTSFAIFDKDKPSLMGDWLGADPDLVWDFSSGTPK